MRCLYWHHVIHILEAGENAVMWNYMLDLIWVYELVSVAWSFWMLLQGRWVGAAAGEEVIIHTLGVMEVGMLMLLAFLTCKEHLFWILFFSLM